MVRNAIKKRIFRIIPWKLKSGLKAIYDEYIRHFPAIHTGESKYDLKNTQVYPHGINFIPVLEEALKKQFSKFMISYEMPVASIGSCFAEEFAFYMKRERFNYLSVEGNKLAASANWGRVYTVPNLLQIVDYSMDSDYPIWVEKSSNGWFDPLREASATPFYSGQIEACDAINNHRLASAGVFRDCNVLIITLGQNEAWIDTEKNYVWARIPPRKLIKNNPDRFYVKEFTHEENFDCLEETVKKIMQYNPDIRIIFTISPVASYACFSDENVISRSFYNKCVLRAVVQKLIDKNKNIFYFPSFEMVLCNNPYSFKSDNRHVKYHQVQAIFSLFSKITLK